MGSLRSLFAPRSVAVLGASRRPGKLGAVMARQLAAFPGPLGLVNGRNPDPANGLYGSVRDVADAQGVVPDLVVACLPAELTFDALAEAAEVGSGAAIICSGGYAEVDEAGRRRQEKLTALAAETGMRLLGPNTSGLIVPGRELVASFVGGAELIPAGGVAVVAASGGMGHTVAFACARDGIGVAAAVGLGNCADVTSADVIEHLAAEASTRCIALHIESVQDGSRLLGAIEAASATTPVVALVVGQADVAEFAASHTGALATSWRVTRSLLEQAGAVVVDDERELVDAAGGLALTRLPAGSRGRTGLVTAQAGPGLLLADGLRSRSVPLPPLADGTIARLGELLPPMTYQRNPVDTGRPGESYADVLRAVADDPSVDVVTVFGLLEPDAIDLAAQVSRVASATGKPTVAVIAGLADQVREVRGAVRAAGAAGVDSPVAAVTVIDALRRDAIGQARLRGSVGRHRGPEVVLRGRPDEKTLKSLLEQAGIAVPRGEACTGEDELRAAFARRSGPVVVKVLEPVLAHKTDVGAVRLGIDSQADLDAAIVALHDVGAVRYLIEEMVPPGLELIVGARRDPVFGAVVVLGLGGTQAELLADVAIRATPITLSTVAEMIDELAAGELLRGYRGGPVADDAELERVLAVLDGVLAGNPSVTSIEINPLRIRDDGSLIALDAKVISASVAAAGRKDA